jgi:hypothetical protein
VDGGEYCTALLGELVDERHDWGRGGRMKEGREEV